MTYHKLLTQIKYDIQYLVNNSFYTKEIFSHVVDVQDELGPLHCYFRVFKTYNLKGRFYYITCNNFHSCNFRSKSELFRFWLDFYIEENPLYDRLLEKCFYDMEEEE